MRSIVIRNVAVMAAALGLLGGALPAIGKTRAAAVPSPRDPLLKRVFSPAAVRFEPAPADLTRRCPDLANARYGARLWVFARAAAPDGDRIVVAGLLTPRRPRDRALVNDQGAVLRLGATDCTLLGPAAEPFANPDAYVDTIPAPLLARLSADAARRYRVAYGQRGLRAALRAAAPLPATLRAPFARAAR